jgi:hypothetical protein
MLVTIIHSIEKNDTYITCFFFVVVRFLDDPIEKLTTGHFLGDQVVELWFVKDVIPVNVARNKLCEDRFHNDCQTCGVFLQSDDVLVLKLL